MFVATLVVAALTASAGPSATAASDNYPPGRLARKAAIRRVATHVCLTTLPTDQLATELDNCIRGFSREIIVDDAGDCDRYGVREDKLPFCQAAVSRWHQAELEGDKTTEVVALVKAYGRCAAATLCSRPAGLAHLTREARPLPR